MHRYCRDMWLHKLRNETHTAGANVFSFARLEGGSRKGVVRQLFMSIDRSQRHSCNSKRKIDADLSFY
jgi:hypothetical protein